MGRKSLYNTEEERKEARRAYTREWRKRNPERNRKHQRDYYARNKDKISEERKRKQRQYSREWYKRNSELVRERQREYYKKNKEARRLYGREWYKRNCEYAREYRRERYAESKGKANIKKVEVKRKRTANASSFNHSIKYNQAPKRWPYT